MVKEVGELELETAEGKLREPGETENDMIPCKEA